MCRSQAEGGQRCFGGAQKRVQAAEAARADASVQYEAARNAYTRAAERAAEMKTVQGRENAQRAADDAGFALQDAAEAYAAAKERHEDAMIDLASTSRGAAEIAYLRDEHAEAGDRMRAMELDSILDQGAHRRDRAALIKKAHDEYEARLAAVPA